MVNRRCQSLVWFPHAKGATHFKFIMVYGLSRVCMVENVGNHIGIICKRFSDPTHPRRRVRQGLEKRQRLFSSTIWTSKTIYSFNYRCFATCWWQAGFGCHSGGEFCCCVCLRGVNSHPHKCKCPQQAFLNSDMSQWSLEEDQPW